MVFSRRMRASGVADGAEQFVKAEVLDEAGVGPFLRVDRSAPLAAASEEQAHETSLHEAVDRLELVRCVPRPEVGPPATVGMPSGLCLPSGFGMYRRLTGCGRYRPVVRRLWRSERNSSTPCCSMAKRVSPSTPAAPLFLRTRFHASARTSPRQIRSNSAWKRRLPLDFAAMKSPRWSFRTLSTGLLDRLAAVMPSHLPPVPGAIKAGPLPSGGLVLPPSSVLRAPRTPSRHSPPSPSAYRGRLRPTWAAGEGLSCSVSGCHLRALLHTPEASCTPSLLAGAVCCLRRDMIGSATSPFGFFSPGAARFTLIALGPQACSPPGSRTAS